MTKPTSPGHRAVVSLTCLLLATLFLAGCQPNIAVSTEPSDVDLSSFHPDVVRCDGFTIQPDVRVLRCLHT